MAKRKRSWYRFLFVSGVCAGLAGTLYVATAWSWVDQPRVRAHITVLPNGGAQETFIVRLPRDRIVDSGAPTGLPAPWPASAEALSALPAGGQVEQFKLRDVEGEVIGIAARHVYRLDGQAESAWVLHIPARGALFLRHDERTGALDATLQQAGLAAGRAWNGTMTLPRTAGEDAGEVLGGTGEFARQQGSYTETWQLNGADAEGVLRGTVELTTRTVRTP